MTQEAATRRTPAVLLLERGPLAVFGVVVVLYALLAVAAYELFGALTIGVTFFPPAGLTLAAFLLLPQRHWPAIVGGIVVAEVLVDMAEGQGFWWSMAWAAANTVEPLVGALIIRGFERTIGFDADFAWAFLVGGLLVGPAMGATIGATNLAVSNDFDWFEGWVDTWVGDALGVLVVAPLVFALGTSISLPWASGRRREIWLGVLLLGVLGVLVFSTHRVPVGYAAIPLLAWIAIRHGPRGLAVAAVIVASLVTAATARDRGPWTADSGNDAHEQLGRQQFFLLFAIGGAWILALEAHRRVVAVEQAQDARLDLARALERAKLTDQVRRERDRIAALQALTAALTAATSASEIAEAVRTHSDSIISGADLRLPGDTDRSAPSDESATTHEARGAVGSTAHELRSRGSSLGILRIGVHPDAHTDPSVDPHVGTVVDLVTQALERARLHEAEQTQRILLGAINDVLASLSAASTVADVASTVERHGLAALGADALALALHDDEHADDIEVVVAVGEPIATAGERIPLTAEVPLAIGVRTGAVTFGEHGSAGRAWAVLPLRFGGRVVGAVWCTRPEPWSDPLRIRALSFASFVADALARTTRAQLDHEVALTLQEALMPRHDRTLGNVRVAGRYCPATGALQIGGDWYEVTSDDAGNVALVVGDVIGHGLAAAAVMGKLSSAASALSATASDPARWVSDLDRFALSTPGGEMATVVCASFSAAERSLRYCRAGHPPPLVRMPDGKVVVLEGPGGGPLGLADRARCYETIELPPGALILAYTDGLIDWRGTSIDQRIAELAAVLGEIDAHDPDTVVDAVIKRMTSDAPQADDIAVLCLVTASD